MWKQRIYRLLTVWFSMLMGVNMLAAQSHMLENYSSMLLGNSSNAWGIYQQTKPAAVYAKEINKTFVAHHGPYDDAYILSYDHENQRPGKAYNIGKTPLPVTDKHSPPVLSIDRDGYIHAFWGAHNSEIQYSKSRKPYDITKWESTTSIDEIGATYLFPFYYQPDDALYVMFRASDLQEEDSHTHKYPGHEYGTMIRSDDGGESWEDNGPLVDLTGHPAQDVDFYQGDLTLLNDKVHFTWGITYGVGHDDVRADIYHAYLDLTDGHIYNIEGDYSPKDDLITWEDHEQFLVYKKDHVMHSNHYVGSENEIYIVSNRYFEKENSWGYILSTWDGTQWETTDTGMRTNNIRHGSSVRKGPDGRIEIFAVAGRSEDPAVRWSYSNEGSNLERAIAQGDDLRILRKDDDGSFQEFLLMRKENHLPQGIHDIQVPNNAHQDLVLVACVATADYGHKNLNLWGIGAGEANFQIFGGESSKYSNRAIFNYPGVEVSLLNLPDKRQKISDLKSDTWYPVKLSPRYLPQNAAGVILEVAWSTKLTDDNSKDIVELRIRDDDTGREADWTSRINSDSKQQNNSYTHEVEIPLGRDGIAYSVSDPEKLHHITINLLGFYY